MRFLFAFIVLVFAGCQGDVLGVLDAERLFSTSVQFTPPPLYRELWQKLEACSGLSRDFDSVKWFSTSEPLIAGDLNGLYLVDSNEIFLTNRLINPLLPANYTIVEHEMMHSLLRGGVAHPVKYFNGVCGWLVP